MCHPEQVLALPPPADAVEVRFKTVSGLRFGTGDVAAVVLPDIYGCTPFYRSFATRLADHGATLLLNPFAGLGPLKEDSRAAAFERRHRVDDRRFVDAVEGAIRLLTPRAVIGFCLGGLYTYELARRTVPAAMVGLYGFPQGLQNRDPLCAPLDYLDELGQPHLSIFGDADTGIPTHVVDRVLAHARHNANVRVEVFPGSGHGFLGDLDSEEPEKRTNAVRALKLCERAAATGRLSV